MPNFDWQFIVVLLALAGAAGFLFRRGVALWRSGSQAGQGKCGGCGSCASGPKVSESAPAVLIHLEPLKLRDPGS